MLATLVSTESNRQGANILVVIGTAHIGMKEVRANITIISLAKYAGIGSIQKSLKELEEKGEQFSHFLAVSLNIDFSYLLVIVG